MLTQMMGIGNSTIRTKLVLMLILPIFGLFYYALDGYQKKHSEIVELESLVDTANLSVQFGRFIHEVQKERGRTALFLASQGKSFQKELKTARERTDREENTLRGFLDSYLSQQKESNRVRMIQQAQDTLDKIEKNRVAVDALTLSSKEALGFYTELNTKLIDLVSNVSDTITITNIKKTVTSYLLFLRHKDIVGLERAETGQAFEQQSLDRAKLARLVQLNTSQTNTLRWFLQLSDNDVHSFYENQMQMECVININTIQSHLFQGKPLTELGIESSHWFNLQTCKLNQLKNVEDHLVTLIKSLLNEHLLSGHKNFKLFIALNLIALLITCFLVLAIANHLTAATQRLIQSLRTFSKGNLGERVAVVFKDELGQISSSFNDMAHKIEKNTHKEQDRIEQERKEVLRFRKRVQLLNDALVRVAKGDLTQRISEEGEDELSQLGQSVNIMIASLATMSKQIETTIQALSTSLEEVQQAAHGQSSGAAQQAAAINETTTTLEEIRVVSEQTLEKAQTLGHAGQKAKEEGDHGYQAVESALVSMRGIFQKVDTIAKTILALSEQTGRIGEITTAVNNLAQQSKMLALNASIEAAKAGEAGKGFAVVAEEVKNLAEQSQQFTTQVHRILEEIRHATDKAVMATEEGAKEVDLGSRLTEQAGLAVQNLLEILRENAIAGQQIVATVRQEAAGIEQIGTAMGEINQVTAQFVASTRQTVQATDDLGQLSTNLQESIRFYRA